VHRPDEGTTLKNGRSGERPVAISPELAELIEDYTESTRYDIADDDDNRQPLFTTSYGRMHENTMRRLVYRVTAPCYRGEDCPGHNEGEKKCPEAVSPHAIRRGSITHFLTSDVPVEVVSDRMNVGRKILDKHYDKRSEEVKLEQRREYLNNI
jgi:integrase